VVKQKTAGSRFHRAVKRIAEWFRLNRHEPVKEQGQTFAQKLRGHYAYYGGVVGNIRCLQRFRYEAVRLWQKWLSRRKRRGQFSWERMNRLLKVLQLPQPSSRVTPCAASP
jgi:RNA-directed DNA polymerase